MAEYRIRLPVALVTSGLAPVVIGLAIGVLGATQGLFWEGAGVGVLLALLLGSQNLARVLRRRLIVLDDGIVVQRDRYRLTIPWEGISEVRRRRHQQVMNAEELVFSGGRVEAVDSRGRACVLPSGLEGSPALTRVMVGLYSKDWREGPIGDKLRELGIAL